MPTHYGAPWGCCCSPATPPPAPMAFSSVQALPNTPLSGDGTTLAVAGLGFASNTGKVRVIFTLVCSPSNFAAAPGVGNVEAFLDVDGLAQSDSITEESYGFPGSNGFGTTLTITSEWVSAQPVGVTRGYQVIMVNGSPMGLPADIVTLSRYTLTVEDVAP